MSSDQREENRRALLQLYQTFLTQTAAMMLGAAVLVIAEVQLVAYSPYVAGALIAGTVVVGFYYFNSLWFWNRRIQTVTRTGLPSDGNVKDWLRYLDYHYTAKQYDKEKGRKRYSIGNRRKRPNSLESPPDYPRS